MVAVGVSSRTPESRRRKASRKRSRMREVLPDPAGPVSSRIDSRLARFRVNNSCDIWPSEPLI